MTIHDQWTALYTAGRVRWMEGMSTNIGARILRVSHAGTDMQHMLVASDHGAVFFVGDVDSDERPDFTDPATIGCLLHQAREAWGDMTAHIHGCLWDMNGDVVPPQWTMIGVTPPVGQSVVGWHLTEPAAILAAIAAAPPKVTE
jgi:hypothetical protein